MTQLDISIGKEEPSNWPLCWLKIWQWQSWNETSFGDTTSFLSDNCYWNELIRKKNRAKKDLFNP